jgi:hypothetical protein
VSTQWSESRTVTSHLVADGWVSPDTYRNFYAPLIDGSAVYLFLLFRSDLYDQAVVAYVGMSTRLKQRIAGHNILPELHMPGHWPMIWFRPVQRSNLRAVERKYITAFDPPWNIIGRRRGVPLHG